jgi:hypothetical protein
MITIEEFYILGCNAVYPAESPPDVSEKHIVCIFNVEKISQARNHKEADSKH